MTVSIHSEQRSSGVSVPPKVLLVPGWNGSGPEHWQIFWQKTYGDELVEQHDWTWPRRGDWLARLDEVVGSCHQPLALVAHSLGCQLVATWARHSSYSKSVAKALLVAPADPEREDAPPQLYSFRPVELAPLPFPTTVVVSSNDPFCTVERATLFAERWRARLMTVGPLGHINAESKLGPWPAGRELLNSTNPLC